MDEKATCLNCGCHFSHPWKAAPAARLLCRICWIEMVEWYNSITFHPVKRYFDDHVHSWLTYKQGLAEKAKAGDSNVRD